VADNIQEFDMTATDQTFVEAPSVADGIILTEEAAGKVKALLEGEGREDLSLRVAVQPGGCSGLRYQLFFDERSLEGDIVREFGGVNVVTDRMSAPYLMGATIDFMDTIEKQGFTIDNPNATGSCACGDSFHGSQRRRELRLTSPVCRASLQGSMMSDLHVCCIPPCRPDIVFTAPGR
jgi:iron-sulfur cluster assembly accessory protein